MVGVEAEEQAVADRAYYGAISDEFAVLTWESVPVPYGDGNSMANLSMEQLGKVGEIVNLAMITASRQYYY